MKTIKLFGLALKGDNFDYKKLSEIAMKNGYLVDEKCSTKEVYDFLMSINLDLSTTFYETWKEVEEKNHIEIFIDQAVHYLSTYGTNHEGKSYVPNENFGKIEHKINFTEYKVIKSSNQDEILEKCDNMLSSGIALSKETINDLFEIYEKFNTLPNIDIVKNKEAKMQICFQKNILPNDSVEFLRYLIFISTDSTLLIKSPRVINEILDSEKDISELIEKFGIEKLSSIFLRFKPLFLAFKKANDKNKPTINKLRKLAVKNHKPHKKGYFEDLLNNLETVGQLPEKIESLNNFKKVSLIEAIRNRYSQNKYNSYIIRNGKFFISENKKEITKEEENTYKLMESIIYNSLVNSIKSKFNGKSFYIPEYLNLKIPKSEKTFNGNVPFGTSIDLPSDNLIIGINWIESDGTDDFDLSYFGDDGYKIGFAGSHKSSDGKVLYSGDVTQATKQATELIYFKENVSNGTLKINRFSGNEDSKYNFFVAKEKVKGELTKNYMVKKENILFQSKLISTDKENLIGIKNGSKFIIQKLITGNKQVSGNTTISEAYLEYTLSNQNNLLSFRKLLIDAGLKVVENKNEETETIDMDFSDIKKDDIISIMS